MKLNEKEQEMLWGDCGPYSEAKIIINTRILDDSVSRIMVEVEGNINPTTFKIVKKYKKEFVDDPIIIDLLDKARYEGRGYGYHICSSMEEYVSEDVMDDAIKRLEYMKASIIKMHKFVLKKLADDN